MPKHRRTLTRALLFNRAFLNRLDPILKVVLGIIALIGALYGFAKAMVDLAGLLQRPQLDVYMSDIVWFIAEPNNRECAINLQFVVHNPTRQMVALRRLEAELTRPSWTATNTEKKFRLEWFRLVKPTPSGFANAQPIVVKPIPAHELEVLAVQLREPSSENELEAVGAQPRERDSSRSNSFAWFPGEYILRLYAYLNLDDAPKELSPRSGFRFNLTNQLAGELSPTDGDLTENLSRPAQLVNWSSRQRK
jgi:hypothetical protein